MPTEREPPQSPASWIEHALDETALEALRERMPATTLWSLLLDVAERRAARRSGADLLRQCESDRFVAPSYIDQRTLAALDRELLEAAQDFEAVELSPLAPLGACSVVALTSQDRIVSTVRGTEIVSDPTNVLALESARRLKRDPTATLRLATSHRCVRAQPLPPLPGYAAHFRMFCLTTAGHEAKDQSFTVDALVEHVQFHLRALDRLEKVGYAFPERKLKLLSTAPRATLARRIAERVALEVSHETLAHEYYDGLRFMISSRSQKGDEIPLIDGGAFDWVGKLAANRKLVFIASAIGSQLAAYLFRASEATSF